MLFHSSTGMPRGQAPLEVIPLKAVVGTVEPTIMFDARFRPASELVRVAGPVLRGGGVMADAVATTPLSG